MFRIAMVSIIVIIGLTGCGEGVSQKPMNKEKLTSDVTSSLDKNKVSTQDVRKNDVQAVAIQSQTRQESQAVVASLVKEENVATEVHAEALKPVREKVNTEVVKEKIATAVHAEALKPVKEKVTTEVVKEKIATAVHAEALKPVKEKVTTEVVKENVAAAPVNVKKATLDSVPVVSPKQEVVLGDAVNGKRLAKRCASCHDFGTRNKVGPPLQGVFNRAAGQSGFKKHSAAFKTANWVWDDSHLLKWLCNSKDAIKKFTGDPTAKTKMPNQKMCGKKGLDIVAYLKTI